MGLRIGPGTWSLLDSGKKGWGCSDAFKESGIPEVLRSVLKARHYEFDVERAIYLTVLHRLFASGSDRAAERWREDYLIPGTEGLDLHHLYQALGFLGGQMGEGSGAIFL